MNFGRSHDNPVLLPLRDAATSRELLGIIEDEATRGRIAATDLSFGPGRGFQIAAEICQQLGIVARAPALLAGKQIAGTELAPWIDGEWQGDFCALSGFELARRIVGALEDSPATTILVLAPRPTYPWGDDNAQLLKFLALGLRDTPHRILIVRTGPGDPPALPAPVRIAAAPAWAWSGPAPSVPVALAAVPGLLPLQLIERMAAAAAEIGLLPLDGGLALLAPEDRHDASQVADADFAALAAACTDAPAGADWTWCRGFALSHGPVDGGSAREICAGAWQLVGSGSFAAAYRQFEQARRRAAPEVAAAIQVDMLRMAISSQHYDIAAETPAPAASLPLGLRRDIHYGTGWGLVMSGRATEALRQFTAPGAPAAQDADPGNIVGLYVINIFALVRSRTGDPAAAMTLERAVEAAAAQCGPEAWHIRYVNAVNIARLHRIRGDLPAAERSFARGFAEIDGLRGESVQVYANLVSGRLALARGAAELARQAILRACLHWLAMPVPEALGWRTARSVLAEPAHVPDGESAIRTGRALPLEVVARISRALLEELAAAWLRSGRELPAPVHPAPYFGHAAEHLPYLPDGTVTLRAAPGWTAVDYRCEPAGVPACLDDASARLRKVVHAALVSDCGGQGFESGAVLLDSRGGREIAQREHERLECAWRWRANGIAQGTRMLPLDDDVLRDALLHARVGPSPAVAGVERLGDGAAVTFRRLRPPHRLTAAQTALAGLLTGHGVLGEQLATLRLRLPQSDVIDMIRQLDSAGLFAWDFSHAAQRLWAGG